MKDIERLAMRIAPWVILLLTMGIFIFDLLTPVGIAVSIFYIIPMLLTLFTSRKWDPCYFSGLATGLLWVGLFLKPPGSPILYGVVNRTLGTSVLWIVALGLVRFRWMQQKTIEAGQELMVERAERAHAEGLMLAAQEARAHADTAVLGATASRREMEKQLLVSQLRLEGIIDSAMDAIITIDEDQRIVLFNRAAEQMFGYSTQEALGQPLNRFLPARFREVHREYVQAFGQSGVTSRKMGKLGTVMGLRSNGNEFPIEAAISHFAVDRKPFYTVILRDITERERVNEELRRQHEFIEAVLETAGALVVVLDRQGRILRFNRACEQTTGYSSEEAIGKAIWDFLIVPDEVGSVRAGFDRLIDGAARNEYENVLVLKDGRRKRIAWSNTVITNQQGSVDYVVCTGIDITLLKQIQEQLRKTERVAELGTLASGMAHEIGTPMNVILGRAEYLLDRVTEEPIKKGLRTIITQVERITRVMNQLLSFARRKAPERVALDLKQIIEDSLEMFQERLTRNQIQVVTEFAVECPLVQADGDQMSQVLINLVMNAVHAMPDGGVIRVNLSPEKQMVKLQIADTGHGIPRDVVKKVFEPFFTTKEFGQGTGLGLTVVKGIIEEHQGSIAVESEEGKGTTFTVLLPMADGKT